MIDPTVFDNLKVVIEGYIYDLDLEREIAVIDRRDIVDLASMSRKYTIIFEGLKTRNRSVSIEIDMPHHELSAELLQTKEKPGCIVRVSFCEKHDTQDYDELLFKKLKRSWGKQHEVKLFLTKEITLTNVYYHHKYHVEFQSLFGEDHLEELKNIVDYTIVLLGLASKS
jgi:hypothetical protein